MMTHNSEYAASANLVHTSGNIIVITVTVIVAFCILTDIATSRHC